MTTAKADQSVIQLLLQLAIPPVTHTTCSCQNDSSKISEQILLILLPATETHLNEPT